MICFHLLGFLGSSEGAALFWYDNDVKEAESRLTRTEAQKNPVIFYGSSSFNYWNGVLEEDFPALPLINLAFGGSTLAACCAFFPRLPAKVGSPRGMVLYAGDNDIGDGRHSEEVTNHFRLIAMDWDRCHPGKPLVFVSIKPSPAREHLLETIRYANLHIKKACDEFDHCHYVDIFHDMLDGRGRPTWDFYESDGLHMNRKGACLWRDRLDPVFHSLFIKPTANQPEVHLPLTTKGG